MASREELLSYSAEDINRMTKAELLALAKAEQKNLKDAIRRLRKSDISSPALKQYEKTGNISAKKSMTLNQLRHEVMKGQVMLRYKTGTVAGAREFQEGVRGTLLTSLSGRLQEPISEQASKNLWNVIDKLVETAQGLINAPDLKYVPKETQQKVYDLIKLNDAENGTNMLNKELTQAEEEKLYSDIYDKLDEEYQNAHGVSYDENKSDLYGFD